MKRMLSITLALVMVLGLCACAGSGEGGKGDKGLQIGYAKVNITPNFQVSLAGYGDLTTRKNTDGISDYVYITCIAAKEGEETVLFFTMDSIGISDSRANTFREWIAEEVDISEDKMFFGATHTHNGPESSEYENFIKVKIVQAAKDALADLSPATISVAKTQTENMTFIRHYKMEDGTYSGANFGNWSIKIDAPAGIADESMMVVKFTRAAEDKKDVVLVNFQAHNDHAKALGYNLLSAGYPGALRDELEAKSGCDVAFFMGASGNLNPSGRMDSEKHNLTWKEYGQKLGQIAYDAMSNLQEVGGSGVASATYTMEAAVDKSGNSMIDKAKIANEMFNTSGKDAANTWAISQGFSSIYHARGVITKYNKNDTEPLQMGVFRIHDLAFVAGPCEMFSETGLAIKADSPFENTFIIMANKGYIPTSGAYDFQCYESHIGTFARGTAEDMHAKYVEMLKSIQ